MLIQMIVAVVVIATVDGQNLDDISIEYETLGNNGGFEEFLAKLSLFTNVTNEFASQDQNLTLYGCFIRMVIDSDKEGGVNISSGNLKASITHIDGCAHEVVIEPPYSIQPGVNITLSFKQKFWQVAYTDMTPNWYIRLGDGAPQLIRNTVGDVKNFVYPIVTDEQLKRLPLDPYFKIDLAAKYEKHKRAAIEIDAKYRFVPSFMDAEALGKAKLTNAVFANIDAISMKFIKDEKLSRDEYKLSISSDGSVEITASSEDSYKLTQSTVQIMLERFGSKLPIGEFHDKPRLEYRGFMFDVSRHFYDKETIKSILDLLWRYKFNTLHLHLTDDEAWSIEIEDIPELTEFGSKQCFDVNQCANYPQLGETINSTSRRFLTKQDYIEILKYAESKGIQVLPEVDIPGHSTAAINSMQLRYEKYPNKEDYRLRQSEIQEYLSPQFFSGGSINLCMNSTKTFVRKILETFIKYHDEAGRPLKLFHFGGDEVPNTHYELSAACLDIGANTSYEVHKQKLKFLGELGHEMGVSLAFWEDGLIDNGIPFEPSVFPKDVEVLAFTWQTVWTWQAGDRAALLSNAGYKVILCPATFFYLDHTQDANPNERGLYWASRYVDLHKTFSFRVENFYQNINGEGSFGPLQTDQFCEAYFCPAFKKPENIVGGQANLFTEILMTKENLDNAMWPRLLAVAERLWHRASWELENGERPSGQVEDYTGFLRALEEFELNYLQMNGIKYHQAVPGIVMSKAETGEINLEANTEFSTQTVWLRKDNSNDLIRVNGSANLTENEVYYLSASSDTPEMRYTYEVEFVAKPTPTTPTTPPPESSTISTTACGNLIVFFLVVIFGI